MQTECRCRRHCRSRLPPTCRVPSNYGTTMASSTRLPCCSPTATKRCWWTATTWISWVTISWCASLAMRARGSTRLTIFSSRTPASTTLLFSKCGTTYSTFVLLKAVPEWRIRLVRVEQAFRPASTSGRKIKEPAPNGARELSSALWSLCQNSVVPTGLGSFSTLPSTPPAAPCWAKLSRAYGAGFSPIKSTGKYPIGSHTRSAGPFDPATATLELL